MQAFRFRKMRSILFESSVSCVIMMNCNVFLVVWWQLRRMILHNSLERCGSCSSNPRLSIYLKCFCVIVNSIRLLVCFAGECVLLMSFQVIIKFCWYLRVFARWILLLFNAVLIIFVSNDWFVRKNFVNHKLAKVIRTVGYMVVKIIQFLVLSTQ